MENALTETDAAAVPGVTGPPFVRLPLRDRAGRVQAHTLVDEADLPLVVGYRWYRTKGGYAGRTETIASRTETPNGKGRNRTVLMARVILGLVPGDGLETEHVSRDPLDNRRSNLKVVTHAQNCQNRRRARNDDVPRGVSFRKDRKTRPWAAYGALDGKMNHLGFFDTKEEAGDAALSWRRANMPYATD